MAAIEFGVAARLFAAMGRSYKAPFSITGMPRRR